MSAEHALCLAGEPVLMLGDRALWLPQRQALLIADLHLGKADVFRRAGIALPRGGTNLDLQRLQQLLQHTGCTQLWILGDILHGPLRTAAWLSGWQQWREASGALQVHLLRGNHDRAVDGAALRLEVHDHARLGPFALRHEPAVLDDAHVLCGHLHPQVSLPALRRRFPAFWLRSGCTILPAFSRFTAGVVPRLQAGEQLLACVEGAIVPMPVR